MMREWGETMSVYKPILEFPPFSYGFNYYGPTGNQRDVYIVARKIEEVDWLED